MSGAHGPKGLTRRNFLKTAGAAGVAACLSAVGTNLAVAEELDDDERADDEERICSVMCRSNCMGSCRWLAHVRDGKVVDGGHGFAGEIGHLSVQLDGPQCRCGRHGCLEVYAGRRSMVERAGLASGDAAASQQAIDMFTQAVFDGAEPMHNVYLKAFGAMVSAIVSTINLSDVDTVIIGGCWAQLSAEERERMQAEVQRQILARDKVEAHILLTRDMRRPALIGAAQIGLRKFVDNPLAYLTADSVA